MVNIITITIGLLLIVCKLQAQAGAHASVSASIISPIGTSKESEMNFGIFSINNKDGEIIITPYNERIALGGVKLEGLKQKGNAATFVIYGSNYDYSINIPTECMMVRRNGSEQMRMCWFDVIEFNNNESNNTNTVAIGATIHVNANQVPGEYEPTEPFDVVITYN